MAQKSLYYKTQFETKVSLRPNQIDHMIDDHIFNNLKRKIDGKAVDNGIVIRTLRLLNYDYGVIDKSGSDGSTIYRVKYECLYCSPTRDMEIVGKIENIVKGYIFCKNGPIIIVVELTKNNESGIFKISDTEVKHVATGYVLGRGDYLKLSVLNSADVESMQIAVMCKLVNIASKADIAKFNADENYINETQSETDTSTFI